MRINHVNMRIGDTILVEPALAALSRQRQVQVNLHVHPHYQLFFENHPSIHLSKQPYRQPSFETPCPCKAFNWSHQKGLPFAAGYFHQLGIAPEPEDRLHFKLHLPAKERQDFIVIAAFAKSCSSQNGSEANIMAPLSWWKPIIDQASYPVISLGDTNDPEIPGAINLRGIGLDEVVNLLQTCKTLVSVETGILHLAGGLDTPTVFLSSATPPWFCRPPGSEVVRANKPREWSQSKTLEYIEKFAELGGM